MEVSVIIPVYNQKQEYFEKAIESVLNQTYRNFELIIIDDGSTNNPKEMLEKFFFERFKKTFKDFDKGIIISDENKGTVEAYTQKIRYFRNEKNMGIGFSRQRGVDEATGDYICFLSSDDIWDEKFLETMIKTAKEQPNKILYSSNYHIDRDGRIIMKFEPPNFDSHEDFCLACLESAYRNNMFCNFSCVFIPKKVFEKVKFKYRFGEDLYFLLISMKHFQYHLVPQYLLKYRAMDNTTSRIRHKIRENNDKIIKEVLEYWKNG